MLEVHRALATEHQPDDLILLVGLEAQRLAQRRRPFRRDDRRELLLRKEVIRQALDLHFELLTAADEVDEAESVGGARVDLVACAEEPVACRPRQPLPSRDAHHTGQGAMLDLREAESGVFVRKHHRAQTREDHAVAARRAVAHDDLGHRRISQALKQLAERGQPLEKVAACDVRRRGVTAKTKVLGAVGAAEDQERIFWPVYALHFIFGQCHRNLDDACCFWCSRRLRVRQVE